MNLSTVNDASVNIPWTWNFSMDEELHTIASIHKENIRAFHELEDAIKKSPAFNLRNPITGECDKIRTHYSSELKRTLETFEAYNSEYNSLTRREAKLQHEIVQTKESVKMKQELSERKEKLKSIKKKYKTHHSALTLAKDMYSKKFGMDVRVKVAGNDCDRFVATVFFDTNEDFPVKLTIDRAQNRIIDFDVSSALAADEEEELKRSFRETNNNLALASALKNHISKKFCN